MRIVTVARKPLGGSTVAHTALTYGSGGLNIDQSRLGTQDSLNGGAYCGEERLRSNHSPTDGDATATLSRLRRGIAPPSAMPTGRWPANLILQHHPECVKVGTEVVKGVNIVHYKTTTATQAYRFYTDLDAQSLGVVSEVQPDVVADVYECHPECPCLEMDRQSGSAGGGFSIRGASSHIYGGGKGFTEATGEVIGYGDQGGASRFFKQVGSQKTRW